MSLFWMLLDMISPNYNAYIIKVENCCIETMMAC